MKNDIMSTPTNPLRPLFSKEHPGETFEIEDVNEWACKEITRLRSELVDTKVLLDNAIVGSAYTDEMLKASQAKVEELKSVIERYRAHIEGNLPAGISLIKLENLL